MSEKGSEKSSEKDKHGAVQDKKHDKGQEKPVRRPQQAVSMKPIVSESGKEVRGVVRLAGKDLRGNLPIRRAIISIRGIGLNMGKVVSNVACQALNMNERTMIGELTEQEIEKLEHILSHPGEYGVPIRMLNRQRDLNTGTDIHAIASDLAFYVKQDIDHEKDAYTWKGYRHTYGQKVRGQRTRSTGRTGMTVGVLRKAVLAKAGAAAAAQTGAAAQAAGAVGAAPAKGAAGAAPKGAPAAKGAPGAAPKAAAAPAKKEEAKK